MHLGYGLFSSLFFLSQFNLYVVILLLVLGCFLDKYKAEGSGRHVTKLLSLRFSWRGWLMVLLALFFVLLLSLLLLRSGGALVSAGSLVSSTYSYK
jgi:hypothetical protein